MAGRATLTNLEDGTIYELPLNPESLERLRQVVWAQPEVPASPVPPAVYVRGEAEALPVTFLIDGIAEGRDVQAELRLLRGWATQGPAGSPPPQLLFAWGDEQFPCVIQSIRAEQHAFDESGRPIQAVVTLTLLQIDPVAELRSRVVPGQQAAPQDRIRVVRAGDTLWGIAQEVLGDGSRWREIWQANPEIQNPDLLMPGQEVRIPGGLL